MCGRLAMLVWAAWEHAAIDGRGQKHRDDGWNVVMANQFREKPGQGPVTRAMNQ